jgi:hypothetical protein
MIAGTTIISSFKPLHENNDESIKTILGVNVPRWCRQGNSLIYDITPEIKEARDYELYKILGFNTYEEYCTKALNGTPEWYNDLIYFAEEGGNKGKTLHQAKLELAEQAKAVEPVIERGGYEGRKETGKILKNKPSKIAASSILDTVENVNYTKSTSSDQGGTASKYRIAKLKRDHPEVAQRLMDGEFKTVRQAERAAGVVPELQEVFRVALPTKDRAAAEKKFAEFLAKFY